MAAQQWVCHCPWPFPSSHPSRCLKSSSLRNEPVVEEGLPAPHADFLRLQRCREACPSRVTSTHARLLRPDLIASLTARNCCSAEKFRGVPHSDIRGRATKYVSKILGAVVFDGSCDVMMIHIHRAGNIVRLALRRKAMPLQNARGDSCAKESGRRCARPTGRRCWLHCVP